MPSQRRYERQRQHGRGRVLIVNSTCVPGEVGRYLSTMIPMSSIPGPAAEQCPDLVDQIPVHVITATARAAPIAFGELGPDLIGNIVHGCYHATREPGQ